jgi:predicted nucleic acid-binding protein
MPVTSDDKRVTINQPLTNERETGVWFLKRLLEASRDKEVDVFTSTLSIAECTHVGENRIPDKVKTEFSRLLMSGQYVKLVQVTPFIAEKARDLRWDHGINLRGADSIHAASALEMKCNELLSLDGRFNRINAHVRTFKRLGLEIRNAHQTTCLPEKYRQLDLTEAKKAN